MPDVRFQPKKRVKPESNWLVKHARKTQSQIGQDGVLEKIFEVIGAEHKFCVEFGAWDGFKYSNTWELLSEKGWSGVLIEGNPDRCQDIIRNHNSNPKLEVVNTLVGWGDDDNLDAILSETRAPIDFDLLSIDIDGNDWHVLNAVRKYRPRVVQIEFNPCIPNDVYFVQDADPSVNQSNSLLALVELAKSKGYSLVCTMVFDAFFVLDEYYPLFGIEDNDIDSMHDDSPHLTKLFYGFDGTVFTTGRQKMLWNKAGIFDHESVQIIPEELRKWHS